MNTRKLIVILIIVCLFLSVFTGHIVGISFEATPSDEPEYGSWNVSEHVRYEAGDAGGGIPPPGPGDSDGDGLSDELEEIIGTDIHLPDTDFDGYTDYEEYYAGTDPLDYNSYPGMVCDLCAPFLFIPLVLWIFVIIPAIIAFLVILLYCRKQEKKKRKRYYVALLLALLLLKIIGIILYLLVC